MEKFECKMCDFSTRVKCNFNRHLSTEKHKKNILNAPKMPVNAPKMPINAPIRSEIVPRNPLACVHCDKVFTHKPSMQRHMNHRCKKNKQLNLIKQQQKTIEIQQQQLLAQRPQTINNNTTNNTVNIQNNTYILPYKDTDTSHLTTKDYAFCVKQPDGVKRLIEKIHFNPMKPENQNLTITNLTDKYMMVYDGSQWKKVMKSELNKIYNHKESLLEEWVEQDPVLREKFYEYIKTERKDVQLQRIEDIKLMMYNQKPVAIV